MRIEIPFNYAIDRRILAVAKVLLLFLALVFCAMLETPAQTKAVKKANAVAEKKAETQPVAVINAIESEYLSGESTVTVNPKQPTVVRLGLAQNAVSVIEFPASDGIYYVHEGNPRLVSVFDSPTKDKDRSITVYPGAFFVTSKTTSAPSAAITLQMRSGLIVILEFVPVADLRKNAHRCLINYDREDVVAARRAAGLAVNLGGEDSTFRPTLKPLAESTLVSVGKPAPNKIFDLLKYPREIQPVWTKPQNGLSAAFCSAKEFDEGRRAVIVAVRNESAATLTLTPGSPELRIVTFNERGSALQSERLEAFEVSGTASDGRIPAGETIYLGVVYKAPLLGTRQRVEVLIQHREAVDAPISVVVP